MKINAYLTIFVLSSMTGEALAAGSKAPKRNITNTENLCTVVTYTKSRNIFDGPKAVQREIDLITDGHAHHAFVLIDDEVVYKTKDHFPSYPFNNARAVALRLEDAGKCMYVGE